MRILSLISSVLLVSCGGAQSTETGPTTPPLETIETIETVETPPPTGSATVAITGVNLAEHCPELVQASAAGAPAVGAVADMARMGPNTNNGFGYYDCYITLSVTGQAGQHVDITKVRLLDTGGASLATLEVSDARLWDGSQFNSWDGNIASSEPLQINYRLHGIDWNAISNSYSRTYKVGVTVEVGGVESELISTEASRQAMVVT